MWTVYVIQSVSDGKHYVGMSEDVNRRLREHNSGKVRSTKSRRPFVLIYTESVKSRAEARALEKYLKSAAGRRFLHKKKGSRGSPPD